MSVFDRIELADLRVFLTIMRTRSFKAAAIQLGLTPSAASHAMRRLEERLGAKLLNRSSRAVAPTDTGLALAARLEEGFDTIGHALAEIDAPGAGRFGELRINVFADAAHLMIAPALPEFARLCPHVKLTVVVEDRPIDIVAGGYDAGIRYGDYVPEDMIAVPLSGPQRWVVAGSPDYLARHGVPRRLEDLAQHSCLQLLLGDNSSYRWELSSGASGSGAHKPAKRGIRVPGLITINDTATTITAAKAGVGLGYLLESRIAAELAEGSLRVVLDEFAARGEPFHMYYSSRRHNHPALRTLVDIIRRQQSLGELR
ncbi:LysR family transcriptional regulator [Janthinobacterium sp. J1-1]|uniref:LysR family transcriptional regulator n=1 Tax=Janthinobacterium sp. J1-1 TaxID=3065910 RepID=UPI002810C968|nr:LysR family transcriptional regulator [Janthinobacterium sp. J1-1]